jgi:tRNA nucleotidyltransferase (CCA-adding enzyme)
MEEELAQALATIDELRSSIQEVNLLNAKLLYMNKVFKGTNLTESQKIDVVKTFDKAETAKEAKLVYESMITTFTKKAEVKSNIKESVGFASKAVGMISGNSNAKVIETDAQYSRWEKLAFGK